MARTRRSRRRYFPRMRHRRSGHRSIPLLPVGTFIGASAYNIKNALDQGWGWEGAADQWIQAFTGYSPISGKFEWQWMMRGLIPTMIAFGIHKGLGWAGVNRTFSRMPAPLNKISL